MGFPKGQRASFATAQLGLANRFPKLLVPHNSIRAADGNVQPETLLPWLSLSLFSLGASAMDEGRGPSQAS